MYKSLAASFYIRNRTALAERLEADSVFVCTANKSYLRSGDGIFDFIQNSNFFYLTGLDHEDLVLVIKKTKNRISEHIFYPKPDSTKKLWDGPALTAKSIQKISGVNNIAFLEDLAVFNEKIKSEIKTLYVNQEPSHINLKYSYETYFNEDLQKTFGKEATNAYPFIAKLRLYKSQEEIGQIKRAIQLSQEGFIKTARHIKAGLYEYEIERRLIFEMKTRRHAFQPIIAAGLNACTLHYIKNESKLKEPESILFDFGAEYGNYKADISRVLPVGSRFTSRQAEVYEAVLDAFYAIKKKLKPGITLKEVREFSKTYIAESLVNLGVLSIKNKNKVNKFYPHGPSHFLGLDVHDVGSGETVLEPGMIVTCEPGIYIRNEKIGIRLENDILITPKGNIDLCESFPLKLKDIENLKN